MGRGRGILLEGGVSWGYKGRGFGRGFSWGHKGRGFGGFERGKDEPAFRLR